MMMKLLLSILCVVVLGFGLWSLRGTEEGPAAEKIAMQTEAGAPAAPFASQKPALVHRGKSETAAPTKSTDFQQVWDMISDGRKEDAIALLQEMLKSDPNNEAVLTELGVIQVGDKTQAAQGIAALTKALSLNPENDRALGDIIFTATSAELRAQTISKIRELQAANPDSANLAAGLGRLLLQQKDYAGAVPYLEKGSKDPKYAESSLSALIDTYKEMGQGAQSAAAYERLIREQERKYEEYGKKGEVPKHLEGRILSNKLGLAAALIDAGQLERADQILGEVRERAPENSDLAHLTQLLSKKRS